MGIQLSFFAILPQKYFEYELSKDWIWYNKVAITPANIIDSKVMKHVIPT